MVVDTIYEGAYQTTLDSGLRILVEEVPQSLSVSVGIWVNVGGRDDQPNALGIAHFMEHLLFKGTTTRDAATISHDIDSVGGYLNAATGRESTCYYADVPADGLSTSLSLLIDLVSHPALELDKIELERSVVLEEIRAHEDDPEQMAYDQFNAEVWEDNHPLSRTVLGSQEAIASIDSGILTDYHRRHYRSEGLVLVACGAVDHRAIFAEVEAQFSQTSDGDFACPERIPPIFRSVSNHHDRATGQTHIYLGLRGVRADSEDRYALSIVNTILGDGPSSRLFQTIREDRGLAYSVGSSLSRYSDSGLWFTYAGVAPAMAQEAIDLTLGEFRRLRFERLSDDAIALAKARLRGSFVLGLESNANRAARLGTTAVGDREILSPQSVLSRLTAITRNDIERSIERFANLDEKNLTTVGPTP